jgi:hypothetical protein
VDFRGVVYDYPSDIVEQLGRHGVRPSPGTPPQRAHDQVSDLYRYELRRLRGRLLRREIPKADYAARVLELRKRYWLLSLPVRFWAAERI